MHFLDLPRDMRYLIASHLDSLASFRLVCRKLGEIRQKAIPDSIRVNGVGMRITNQTTAADLQFLHHADPDTLIIFERFSPLTLELTRSILPRFNKLHFYFHSSGGPVGDDVSVLIADTLSLLGDMVELGIGDLPPGTNSMLSFDDFSQPGDDKIVEAAKAVLQRSERTLRSIRISLFAPEVARLGFAMSVAPPAFRDLLASLARCPHLTSIDMARLNLGDSETEAHITRLVCSLPNLRTFRMFAEPDYAWHYDCSARILAALLTHCPLLVLDVNIILFPYVARTLLPLLAATGRSFPAVTGLTVFDFDSLWHVYLPQLTALFPAVQRLDYADQRCSHTLSAAEWQAIDAGLPQLRHIVSLNSRFTAQIAAVPSLLSRLERYGPYLINMTLAVAVRLGPSLPKLREVRLITTEEAYGGEGPTDPARGSDGHSLTAAAREAACGAARSLACAPVLQDLRIFLAPTLRADFISCLPPLPALTTLKIKNPSLWTTDVCWKAREALRQAIKGQRKEIEAGQIRCEARESLRALKDSYQHALHNDSQLCAAPSQLAVCLALCPALTDLQCALFPQDIAEMGSSSASPYPTLRTLCLTVESLASLLDSQLLRRFLALRELSLEVLSSDVAQLKLLAEQCPQLVRLTVWLSDASICACEPISVVEVVALVSRLPRLRYLALGMPIAVADDGGDDDTPDSDRLPADMHVLLQAVPQLTTLGLCVGETLARQLRRVAPWCAFAALPPISKGTLWFYVEQSLQQAERREERARTTEQRVRVNVRVKKQ